MFNLAQNSRVRGKGYLLLNALRALTMVGLVTVMAASWVMIVLSGLKGNFDFFDCISHFFLFGICVFLLISETPFFRRWFEANWPVLSQNHSLAWLGLALIVIGCSIMADLRKPAYFVEFGEGRNKKQNFPRAMQQLVMAAGILSIVFGSSNILASVVFRDGKAGITARHIRSDGSVTQPQTKAGYFDDCAPHDKFSQHRSDGDEQTSNRFTKMFKAGVRKSRIQISRPFNLQNGREFDVEDGSSHRGSPIVRGLQRPESALHPINQRRTSLYSEAAMSRF